MNENAQVLIRAALDKFDQRCAFLWHYIGAIDDPYLPEDRATYADYYGGKADDAIGHADRFEDARRTLVEEMKAAIAAGPPPLDGPDEERHWNNFRAGFDLHIVRDMATFWKAFQILLDHYVTNKPTEPEALVAYFQEVNLIAMEFTHQLRRARKKLTFDLSRCGVMSEAV